MILPKIKVKKILYATDLSDSARHAFAYAVSLANSYGAGITILHSLSSIPNLDPKIIGHIGANQWEEMKQRQESEARAALIGKKRDSVDIPIALEELTTVEDQNVVIDEILVRKGDPVDEILKQSQKRNCDLIVMGTHDHGVIEETIAGSTARKLLRRSTKPVLVVRLPDE
jgi:nucleotide-binding universal stress UspA family protein